MATLTIEVSDAKGVSTITARPRSVSEADAAGRLSARLALLLSLVDEVAREGKALRKRPVRPQLWVPRGGDISRFEQLELWVADAPRPLYDRPAPWLASAMRQKYPNHSVWSNVQDLDGEAEAALVVLFNHNHTNNGFLDHAGWSDDPHRGVILVSEPYCLSSDQISDLHDFCKDTGLEFRIGGISNHYPSRTFRVEIWSPAAI